MMRILGRAGTYVAVLALAAVVVMPMYWLLVSAFKASDEIFTATPRWLPASLEWSNFARAWQGAAFGRYFFNSVVVALAILLLQLTTASLAAFALARRRFPGRGIILLVVIGALIIPIQVTFLANFITLDDRLEPADGRHAVRCGPYADHVLLHPALLHPQPHACGPETMTSRGRKP